MYWVRAFSGSAALIVAVSLVAGGCSDEPASSNTTPQEFVATAAAFGGYNTWQQTVAPLRGPDPAGMLGGAHEGNDSSMTRSIVINPATAQRGSNGEFPVGTVLVKELRMTDGTVPMITAMAKRGGEFNRSGNGWEWFLVSPGDGSILARGDTLMGGMCQGCHSAKASQDYVFTR